MNVGNTHNLINPGDGQIRHYTIGVVNVFFCLLRVFLYYEIFRKRLRTDYL